MPTAPKALEYDWVAYDDKASGRVYFVNAKEGIASFTVPRGTPPRKVQKVVQSLDDEDSKKRSLAKRNKKFVPQSFDRVMVD
jgi:hypothetical protein